MPQIGEPYLQENCISKPKRKGLSRLSWGNRSAESLGGGDVDQAYRLFGSMAVPIRKFSTNSREDISATLMFENCCPSTRRRGGCHIAKSRTFRTKVLNWNVVAIEKTLYEFIPTCFKRNYGYLEKVLVYNPDSPMLRIRRFRRTKTWFESEKKDGTLTA
jgi:hypothetical protein